MRIYRSVVIQYARQIQNQSELPQKEHKYVYLCRNRLGEKALKYLHLYLRLNFIAFSSTFFFNCLLDKLYNPHQKLYVVKKFLKLNKMTHL